MHALHIHEREKEQETDEPFFSSDQPHFLLFAIIIFFYRCHVPDTESKDGSHPNLYDTWHDSSRNPYQTSASVHRVDRTSTANLAVFFFCVCVGCCVRVVWVFILLFFFLRGKRSLRKEEKSARGLTFIFFFKLLCSSLLASSKNYHTHTHTKKKTFPSSSSIADKLSSLKSVRSSPNSFPSLPLPRSRARFWAFKAFFFFCYCFFFPRFMWQEKFEAFFFWVGRRAAGKATHTQKTKQKGCGRAGEDHVFLSFLIFRFIISFFLFIIKTQTSQSQSHTHTHSTAHDSNLKKMCVCVCVAQLCCCSRV